MGYQDRDYYREQAQEVGVRSMVIRLIIINAVLFLADAFFGGQNHALTGWLALRGDALVHPWMWYQFLSAGFAHDPAPNLMHIAGNMLGLYVFGRPLEEKYGKREFLRFYLVAIVLGSVLWAVRNYFFVEPTLRITRDGTEHFDWGSMLGASGGVTATMILYCWLYPRATLLLFFAIPTPAWLAAVLLIALDVFGTKFGGLGARVAHDVHLTGAAFAFAYWYFGWNLGRLPGSDSVSRLWRAPKKWFRKRPNLRAFDPESSYEDLDAEGDRLLEKVGREGQASLTPRERRVLEDYSRRMRQKRR